MARDDSLALQLRQAPNARERARLLDVDWDRVVGAYWRLTAGTAAIGILFVVALLTMAMTELSGQTIAIRPVLDGLIAALVVAIARLLVSGVAIQLLSSSRLSPLRQQLIAVPLEAATGTVGLLVAFAILPYQSDGGLILGFALVGSLFSVIGVQSLPIAILFNDPNLQAVVTVTKQIPADLTLLGGRARWVLAYFTLALLEATAIALLFWAAPVSAALVVPVHAAVSALVARTAWVRGAASGLVVAGTATAVLLATAVTVVVVR